MYTHGYEPGWIGKPGLDEGGDVEDDAAAGDRVEDGAVVRDVTVGELEGGVGRQGGEVGGPADQCSDGVALVEEAGAEPASQETSGAGQQDLHPFSFSRERGLSSAAVCGAHCRFAPVNGRKVSYWVKRRIVPRLSACLIFFFFDKYTFNQTPDRILHVFDNLFASYMFSKMHNQFLHYVSL